MKNKFSSKIFVILVTFLLFFLILTNCSKAVFTDDFPDMFYPAGITPSKNNTDIQGNQTRYVCNKVLVKYKGNDSYYIINYISADYNSARRLYIASNNIVEMEGILYKQYLRWNGSDWSYAGWSGYSGGNASNVSGEISYTTLVNNCEIVSASKNIYKDNTFKDVFFSLPPQTNLGLVEIMKQEKAEAKTIQEILGVLPLIIVVVVSFLGLRKALKMLLNFLNNS